MCRELLRKTQKSTVKQVLIREAPNLSPHERSEFARWIDKDGDGVITLAELQAAFTGAESAHSQAEGRSSEICTRVRDAILRSGQPAHVIFGAICGGRNEMQYAQFDAFIRKFVQDIAADQMTLLWRLVDKNNDGGISFEEFARYFVNTTPIPPKAPVAQRPVPPPLDSMSPTPSGSFSQGMFPPGNSFQSIAAAEDDKFRMLLRHIGWSARTHHGKSVSKKNIRMSSDEFGRVRMSSHERFFCFCLSFVY